MALNGTELRSDVGGPRQISCTERAMIRDNVKPDQTYVHDISGAHSFKSTLQSNLEETMEAMEVRGRRKRNR